MKEISQLVIEVQIRIANIKSQVTFGNSVFCDDTRKNVAIELMDAKDRINEILGTLAKMDNVDCK